MKKITQKNLDNIEKRMAAARKAGDIKRWTFLAATHNLYSKALGIAPRFTW